MSDEPKDALAKDTDPTRSGFKELFDDFFDKMPGTQAVCGTRLADLTPEEADFIESLQLEYDAIDAAFRAALAEHRDAMAAHEKKRRAAVKAIRARIPEDVWPLNVDGVFNTTTRAVHRTVRR